MTRILLALVTVVATSSLAGAQDISFDRLALLVNQGDTITVTDADGRRLHGQILDLSPSTLTLQTGAIRHELDGSEVSVVRGRERDPLRNGALIGFAVGAGYVVSLAVRYRIDDPAMVYFAFLMGGAGAGIGVGLDSLHEDSRVIYRAAPSDRRLTVSPVLSPERQGLSVSFGF